MGSFYVYFDKKYTHIYVYISKFRECIPVKKVTKKYNKVWKYILIRIRILIIWKRRKKGGKRLLLNDRVGNKKI